MPPQAAAALARLEDEGKVERYSTAITAHGAEADRGPAGGRGLGREPRTLCEPGVLRMRSWVRWLGSAYTDCLAQYPAVRRPAPAGMAPPAEAEAAPAGQGGQGQQRRQG
jgi:hypothetical protein